MQSGSRRQRQYAGDVAGVLEDEGVGCRKSGDDHGSCDTWGAYVGLRQGFRCRGYRATCQVLGCKRLVPRVRLTICGLKIPCVHAGFEKRDQRGAQYQTTQCLIRAPMDVWELRPIGQGDQALGQRRGKGRERHCTDTTGGREPGFVEVQSRMIWTKDKDI